MRIKTPYERYQRLPPRRKFIRSVTSTVLLIPMGVAALWFLGWHFALIGLMTFAWLTVGVYQSWTTYHEWKANPDAVPERGPSVYSLPALLLLSGVVGLLCFLGALFSIAETGQVNSTLLWFGGAFVTPPLLHCLWVTWRHAVESNVR